MSCEDSLSQSLLEPSEASKQEQVPVLLEEVKSLQDAVLHEIDKEDSSPSSFKLDRIKAILQSVNKDLAEEKQHLSSLKVSLSQSFSKTENDQSDREIKEKARKLVLFQRRLLAAFQVQKSIAEKMKERKLKKKNQISSIADLTVTGKVWAKPPIQQTQHEENSQQILPNKLSNELSSTHTSEQLKGDNFVKDSKEEMMTPDTSLQSFSVTERRVSYEKLADSEKQDLGSSKSVSQPILTAATSHATNHDVSNLIQFIRNSSTKGEELNLTVPNLQLQAIQPVNKFISNAGQQRSASMPSSEALPIQLDTNAPVMMIKIAQKQANLPNKGVNKKLPVKRKRADKKQVVQQNPVLGNVTLHSNATTKPQSQVTQQVTQVTQVNNTQHQPSICNGLPLLDTINNIDHSDFGILDISKLKFLVTPKDEEFLEGSICLPKYFWDSDLKEVDCSEVWNFFERH